MHFSSSLPPSLFPTPLLIHPSPGNDIVEDVGVLCNSEDITLTLRVSTADFNGMIYPKGLSKNSTCMTEYIQQKVKTD